MLQGSVGKFLDLLNHWLPLNKQKPMVSSPGKSLMLVAPGVWGMLLSGSVGKFPSNYVWIQYQVGGESPKKMDPSIILK